MAHEGPGRGGQRIDDGKLARGPTSRLIAEAGEARRPYTVTHERIHDMNTQHDEVATFLSTWEAAEMSGDAGALGEALAGDFTVSRYRSRTCPYVPSQFETKEGT